MFENDIFGIHQSSFIIDVPRFWWLLPLTLINILFLHRKLFLRRISTETLCTDPKKLKNSNWENV